MAELVDALASGASARKGVEVRVFSWAPSLVNKKVDKISQLFLVFQNGDNIYVPTIVITSLLQPTRLIRHPPFVSHLYIVK